MPIIKLTRVNYTYSHVAGKSLPIGLETILFNTDNMIKAEQKADYTHIQYSEGVIVSGLQCKEKLEEIYNLIK